MHNVRMPDGTVIRGVPDGVGRDDFNAHLIEKYGQEKFDSMTAAGGQTSPFGKKVIAERNRPTAPLTVDGEPYDIPRGDGPTWDERAEALRNADSGPVDNEDSLVDAQRDRDYIATQKAKGPSAVFGGFGGGKQAVTEEERAQEIGDLQRRMIDLKIRTPEDYGYSQEDFDEIMVDRVQQDMLARQGKQLDEEGNKIALEDIGTVLGERTGFEYRGKPAPKTEREISEEAGYWRYLKEHLKSLPPLIWKGGEAFSRAQGRLDAQNLKLGHLYLDRIATSYQDEQIGEDAQDIVEAAAAKYGMTPDQYAKFTANAVDVAFEKELVPLEESAEIMQEVQKYKPRSADDTFLGHIGALVIENVQNVGYIAAGVVTVNPVTTMALMGTDIYARTFTAARLDGRSVSDANMDAWASTVIEAVTEGVPVGKFIGLMKAGQTGKAMKMLQGVATETGQEILAEGAQIGYDILELNEDMTWGDVFYRLRDAGIIGGLMGAAIGGPIAVLGDNNLTNANTRINEAKKKLQSVANRVLDPKNKGTVASKEEAAAATKEYADAVKAKRQLLKEREEAKAEKKKAKADKRAGKVEKKAKKKEAKLPPQEKKRAEKQRDQRAADQSVKGAVTKEDTQIVSLIEDVVAGEQISQSAKDLLLDSGYAKVTKAGSLVILPSGNRRAKAVRDALEATGETLQDEVIEVIPFESKAKQRRQAEVDAEIGRLIRDEEVIKPIPYKTPENRKAELEAKVRKSVTEPAAREKIVQAIVKADEEVKAHEEREAEVARATEAAYSAQYEEAVAQVKEVDAEVALNLAQLEQKGVYGKATTRLGNVFRAAEKKLKEAADKARKEMDDAFWSKPNQGQLFDITGVLVKGSTEYVKAVKVGAYKLAQHGAKYSAWAADMVGEFGESIKPMLVKIYNDAKKNVGNVLKWSHEKFGKAHPRRGELKYAPKQYAKPGTIKQLRLVLEKLAGEGKAARKWYEKSGAAILKATSNIAEARLFAGLLAIYSTATGVGPNLTNALKMWSIYQSGKIPVVKQGTLAGRFGMQDKEAVRWLKGDMSDTEFISLSGDKITAFFTNLMRSIDPKTYEFGQGVTVDIWMMRAFGYDVGAPSDAQYSFAAIELRQLAEKLGWERQHVQAAVWVSIKARWSYIQKKAHAVAVKRGLAEINVLPKGKDTFDVLGGTRAEQVVNEKKIILIFREEALKATVGEMEAALGRSRRDFSDFIEAQYATISWESDPSTSLGLIFNSMPIEDRILLQYEISQVLTNPETGREYLAEWLGLLGSEQFQGPGAWDGAVGVATQNQVMAPLEHKKSKVPTKTVQPQTAQALDGYAAIIGFLLKQDAVAWHRPFFGQTLKRSNGISIAVPENMDPAKFRRLVSRFYAAIIAEAQAEGYNGMDWAPIALNGEMRVLNFSDVGNRDFHEIILKAADKAKVGAGNVEVFQTDGNLISNDWVTFPEGEQYEQAINSSENAQVKKAFGRAKSELAKRVDAVYGKYTEKYKTGRRAAINVTIRVEGKAEPKLKKGYRRFRIFRKAKYDALKTEFFGQGLRGTEKKRGSIPVISAYPDKGFRKEVGLGNVEYIVDVKEESLYDANNDPLRLKEKADYEGRLDFTKYERLIKGAGFVGYYTPKADGNLRGQARFFEDLTVGKAALTSTLMVPERPVIRIKENELDEFEVVEQNGEVYYTDDADDAISTARSIYGQYVVVEIVDEHDEVIVTDYPKPIKLTVKAKLASMAGSLGEFLVEFSEETMENPLVNGERILGKGSTIELNSRGGAIWIDSIRSFEQGTGQGNEALKFITELANKHGVRLQLFAKTYSEGLDQESLVSWYKRNGFVRSREDNRVMVRMPTNVNHTFSMWKRPKTLTNAFMGMDLYEAETLAEELGTELGIDNIKVVESVEGLPDDLYVNIVQNGFGGLVQGAFHDDFIDGPTIYVIANNITEGWYAGTLKKTFMMKLREVVMHEALGHFGLQSFLGPKKYNQFVDSIRREFPKEVAMRLKQGGMYSGVEGQRLAAEEVFAYWVQARAAKDNIPKKAMGFIERLIFDLKLLLAQWGWTKQEMSDAYMEKMLLRVLYFTRNHTTAQLQKRARKTSQMREAKRDSEAALGTLEAFSLKEDPLLESFDEKAGNKADSKFTESLRSARDWFFKNTRERFAIWSTDEFAGILFAEKELEMEGPTSGYMSVRLAAGVDVIIRSALENAVPTWNVEADGSASVKMDDTVMGLTEILARISSPELLISFQRYLVANRSRRLIREGKEKLINRDEIAAVLKDVRKSGQYKLFVEVQKDLAEYKSRVLDFAQEAGLIDPVSRKLWEKNDHVPFYRVLEANDKSGAFAKLGSVGKVIYQQKGSKAALKPALENIFDNISMLIEASVKNRAMTDVINQFKGTGIVTPVPPVQISTALIPMDKIKEMLNENGVSLDAVGNELLTGVQRLMSIQPTQEEGNIVSVQVKGKKKFYYVHDEGVMRGMENVGIEQHSYLMRILRAPKRLITTIITRFPGFVLANWFRDMLHSVVLVRDGIFTPLDSFIGWGKAIAQDKTFKELMAGGGMFDSGYINTNDPSTTTRAMRKKLMSRGRSNILDSPRKIWNMYMRIANGAENAARVQIFEKTLRKTGSRKQALYEARDIMDFSVRGSGALVQFFIETVPFLGARWQGINRTKRGLLENPALVSSRGMMIVLATLALFLHNRKDERYQSLLDYDKHMYYHFFDVFEEGDHYRLPKPFEVGAIFSTIPEIGLEYMLSQEPDRGDAAADAMLWTLMEQFNMRPMVQAVAPMVELAMNKNFFTEAPIENYWESQLDASRRYGDRTNKTVIWLAQQMPKDAPDFLRSPKQLEFLIKRYFATFADYSLKMSDRMFFSEDMPTPRWDETVGFQRFKREAFPKFDKWQQDMYEVLNEADKIYYTILDLRKEKTETANAKIKLLREQEYALLWARKKMQPTIKEIQRVNKRIRFIHESSKTPDQKREAIDKLIDRKRKLSRRIYEFRPGGKRNPRSGGSGTEPYAKVPEFIDDLIGMSKRQQVDYLISAKLPHTATLINDVTIGLEKLRKVA